jgi:hypothetical protein
MRHSNYNSEGRRQTKSAGGYASVKTRAQVVGTEEGMHRQQQQHVEEGGEEGVGEEAWEDGVAFSTLPRTGGGSR